MTRQQFFDFWLTLGWSIWKHKGRIALAIAFIGAAVFVVFMWGCGAIPMQRESAQQTKQTENTTGKSTVDAMKTIHTEPAPVKFETTTPDGVKSTIEVPPVRNEVVESRASASENASFDAASEWSFSQSIPGWVHIIGYCIAAALVGLVMKFTNSKALKSAFVVADDFMAQGINSVRGMAQVTTDPKDANLINSIVSLLEQKRAEYNKD